MSAAAHGVGHPGAAAAGARLLEVLAAHERVPDQAELDEISRNPVAS
jgi:hypothetical protein